MSASTFLTLGKSDFVKGAIVAVIGAVFGAVYSILKNSGFDVFSIDWSLTLQASINAAITAFVTYLSKNLLTDNDRHETVAGIIPTK